MLGRKNKTQRVSKWAAGVLALGAVLGGGAAVAAPVAETAEAAYNAGVRNTGSWGALVVRLDNGRNQTLYPGQAYYSGVSSILIQPNTCVTYWNRTTGPGGWAWTERKCAGRYTLSVQSDPGVNGAWRS